MPLPRFLSSIAIALFAIAVPASAAESPQAPKPFVIAPTCSSEQLASAAALLDETARVVGCFLLEKWSFKGVALALVPAEFEDRVVSQEDFRQLRKRIFREQSVRLRAQRIMAESMPGEPPTHASTPMSLFVRARTPLGVFMDESNHIGFADLVPLQANANSSQRDLYPIMQLETWVYVKGKVFKLMQMAPISGMGTVRDGFVMADDWARRFNGGERLASED